MTDRLVFGEADPKKYIAPEPPCDVLNGGCGHAFLDHVEPLGCHHDSLVDGGRGMLTCLCEDYVRPLDEPLE